MTNSSNYKIHLPVVKLSPEQKITSVTPAKLFLTREKYYQNNVEHEWEQENYIIYNSYVPDGKA